MSVAAALGMSRRPLSWEGAVARRVPYPYRAMLALCSDLDETPDRHVYLEIARFLNTASETGMGPGLDLEVGNSIYFDMPPDQFAYWNTDDVGRQMVRDLVRSGHIDCLHSFGDLARTRADAARALDELHRHDCRLSIWVDHAVAPTNFGADIMRGRGDVPRSDAYHADLTTAFGVRYVWRGRVTSVIGQDVERRLGGIGDVSHPLRSGVTLGKEVVKGLLSRAGSAKYAVHAPNRVLAPVVLRDGRRVLEFLRSNPCWRAVDRGETADGLAGVLTQRMLETLVEREGAMVLYTHLGKVRDRRQPLGPATRARLRDLARRYRDGELLVTTTKRLLALAEAADAPMEATAFADSVRIDVATPLEPAALGGFTVYVDDPARVRLAVGGREVPELRRNPPDRSGRPSVSIPRVPLEFPPEWSAPR